MSDTVFFENGAWYFCDEVQADRYGPFATKEEAYDELFIYSTAAKISVPPIPLDDDSIRAWWRKQGGSFHGPNVETGTMPGEQLLPALRKVFDTLNAAHQRCERFAERLLEANMQRPAGDGRKLQGRDSEVVVLDEPELQ